MTSFVYLNCVSLYQVHEMEKLSQSNQLPSGKMQHPTGQKFKSYKLQML